MRWRSLFYALFFLVTLGVAADQKKKGGVFLYKMPDQVAVVRNVPNVLARQRCENFSWAAGVETSLRAQNVELDQGFWTDKIYGGAICLPSPGEMENLARSIEGEYVLPGGGKFRLAVHYISSMPTRTDPMLVPLALGRPYVLWWKGHAYVAVAAKWDDFVYPNGQRDALINEITLVDPYEKGDKHTVKFLAGRDRFEDISGIFDVEATSLSTNPWQSPK